MNPSSRHDYDKYIKDRGYSSFKVLFIKLILYLNTTWNFSNSLRNTVYNFIGVNINNKHGDVFIAREVLLDDNFPEMITIEEGVAIGWRVMFLCHDALDVDNKYVAPITVKSKAVIGAGSIILPGVVIGENAIIGAGAIVRESVPDYGIVIGPQSTCNWKR